MSKRVNNSKGVKPANKATEKLIAASKREEIKAFRHNMAILKKAGLWEGNAKSVTPTKHYKGVLRKYAGVITGEKTVVKGTPAACYLEGCDTFKRKDKTYSIINTPKLGTVVKQSKQGFSLVDLFTTDTNATGKNGWIHIYNNWNKLITKDGTLNLDKYQTRQKELTWLKENLPKYWKKGGKGAVNPTFYRLRIADSYTNPDAVFYAKMVREYGFSTDVSAYGSQVQA